MLTILLLIRGYQMHDEPWLITVPLWGLQQTHQLKDFLIAIVGRGALQLILYLLLGFLAALSFSPQKSQGASRSTHLSATVFGIALSTVVSALANVGLKPNVLDILVPAGGCFVGAWLGVSWAAGGRARRLIWLKLTFFTATLILAVVVLAQLFIDEVPFAFEAEQVKSEDRVRLIKLIRSKSPGHIPDNETATLKLSEHDINVLLTWGLSLGSPDRKARISLNKELATIHASIGFPFVDGSLRYINFSAAGWALVKSGQVDGHIKQLTIGSVSIPNPLLRFLSSVIVTKMADEPLLESILAKIILTEINQNYASVTYQKIDMSEGFRDKIFASMGPVEVMRESLTAQFKSIQKIGDALPKGSKIDLGVFMRAAFVLAYQRSENSSPVLENRAAIIALGVSIGHHVIAKFISGIPYEVIPNHSLSLKERVTLHQRVDWSRHFLVSAALEVISSESISLNIGLLKEELDTGKGGSGFSFADLAADRSGTMFAKFATLDKKTAKMIQLRMIQGFSVGDYVPPISDLPESIFADNFITDYGGTNGRLYKMMLREIDRRIANCDAYR